MTTSLRRAARGGRAGLHALVLSALLSACALPAVTLVAPYDQATDDRVSEILGDSAKFFDRIEKGYGGANCRYSNNTAFYEEAFSDLAVLEARAAAISQNQSTVQAAGYLRDTIKAIERAHARAEQTRRDRCLLPDLVRTNREAVTSAVVAILTLELAKKR